MADQAGRLGLGPDHEPRGVDQRDDRQAEGVAELQEARRLVGGVAGDRAGHVAGVVGDHAERAALDPGQRGDHLRREALAQEGDRALVGERLDDRPTGRRRGAARSGTSSRSARLVGLGARRSRPLEVGEQPLGRPPSPPPRRRRPGRPRRCRPASSIGPTSSGSTSPRPPPSIIAGPPIPSETFSVATIRSEQPAITALPAKQRPATTAIRGTSPESLAQSAKARVSSAETTG